MLKRYWPILVLNIILVPLFIIYAMHVFPPVDEKIYEEPSNVNQLLLQSEKPEDSTPQKEYLGQFNLSRYYTVIPNQKRYYLNRTYEEDFEINCQGDCYKTASGHLLSDDQWGKVVACPPNITLGSRLLIEGLGEVTCQDRGGAIKGKKLDIWMGVGDAGVDRLYAKVTTYGGERQVYLLK